MKIGLVAKPWIPIPSPAYGAIEKLVYYMLLEWQHTTEVMLFAPGDSKIPTSETIQLNALFEKGVGDFIFDDKIEIAQAMHAAQVAQIHHLDIMNAHAVDAFLALAPFLQVPTVFSVHTMPNPVLEAITRLSPNTHYVFLTVSHRHQFSWIKNASIIPPGINPKAFPFQKSKSDYLMFIGQLVPEKGCIEAIDIARQAGLPLKMAGIVPAGAEVFFENTLKTYIKKHNHVEFLGEINDLQRNHLLKSARALLFPIKWDEPFGIVMLESLVVGTPVIAFNRGSVAEVITHGETGFIVENVDEAVSAVDNCKILSSDLCRQHVISRFHSHSTAQNYLNLFHSVLKDGGIS